MRISADKFGLAGLFLTAFFSPCCFPLFAFVASALGLGSIELFGGWTMLVFQGFAVITLLGFFLSYRKHHCSYALWLGLPSAFLIFYGYYFNDEDNWRWFLYSGMLGLTLATGVNYYRIRLHRRNKPAGKHLCLSSTVTCPECGYKKEEQMPTEACSFFYECVKCKTVLKPKPGDCCVFCSYGSVKCPPIQAGTSCC